MTPEQQNLQSRIETLDALYNIIKVKLSFLDPLYAIDFSQPLADELLRTAHILAVKEKKKNSEYQGNEILNQVLNKNEE